MSFGLYPDVQFIKWLFAARRVRILIGGSVVIFYDTDWNPAMDRQAMDRCHRLGQTRDVIVYRLITEASIEENIWRKQLQKRLLDDVVVDQGHFTAEGSAFDKTDVKELLFTVSLNVHPFVLHRGGCMYVGMCVRTHVSSRVHPNTCVYVSWLRLTQRTICT